MKARSEADMIAAALTNAPMLDRESMGADLFPFNDIASSDPVITVVDKLVRARAPQNPWIAAHAALMKTDETGNGYAAFTDVFRDAAFQVGVDYALRSTRDTRPEWWAAYQSLDARTQLAIGVVVRHAAKGGAR